MASMYCDMKIDSEGLPNDHFTKIAFLPYFKYVQRPEAERLIEGTINKYIIRCCGDKSDYINGAPNPNLFLISVCMENENQPGKIEKRHIKVVRHPELGLRYYSIQSALQITHFPTLKELIANSPIIYMITPLE
jgi:hypothetical protein